MGDGFHTIMTNKRRLHALKLKSNEKICNYSMFLQKNNTTNTLSSFGFKDTYEIQKNKNALQCINKLCLGIKPVILLVSLQLCFLVPYVISSYYSNWITITDQDGSLILYISKLILLPLRNDVWSMVIVIFNLIHRYFLCSHCTVLNFLKISKRKKWVHIKNNVF